MTWMILGGALAAVVTVVFLLRRELLRWQDGGRGFALLAPLRMISGSLLIVVFLLVAGGLLFALPRPGADGRPNPVMIAYWVFILLLLVAVVVLTMIDMLLVRRGFQMRQDEALRDAMLGGPAGARDEQTRAEGEGA